jgi:polar amino acid transport system substrate-binding protein
MLAVPCDAQSDTVPLVTGEWAPYTSETLEGQGFITEIISEVLLDMGVEPSYEFHQWKRCYSLVVRGQVWAAFPYAYTEERAQEVLFSETVGESTTKFFYYQTPKTETYETLEELKPYKIAGVKGYFYEEEFIRVGLDVSYTSDETSALKRLAAGRVDLLPLNELVGWALIKQHFPDQTHEFGTLPEPYSISELKLIVSKDYPRGLELLEQFNVSLKRVKTTEDYKAILRKYGLTSKTDQMKE